MERKELYKKWVRAMNERALEPGEERIDEMAPWKIAGLRRIITQEMQAAGIEEPFRVIYFRTEGDNWICGVRTKSTKRTFSGSLADLETGVTPKKPK